MVMYKRLVIQTKQNYYSTRKATFILKKVEIDLFTLVKRFRQDMISSSRHISKDKSRLVSDTVDQADGVITTTWWIVHQGAGTHGWI